MSDNTYLKPKAGGSPSKERKKSNGMFQNVSSYPQLGGFSSSQKVAAPNRPMGLEGNELTRKGKPI